MVPSSPVEHVPFRSSPWANEEKTRKRANVLGSGPPRPPLGPRGIGLFEKIINARPSSCAKLHFGTKQAREVCPVLELTPRISKKTRKKAKNRMVGIFKASPTPDGLEFLKKKIVGDPSRALSYILVPRSPLEHVPFSSLPRAFESDYTRTDTTTTKLR